MTTIDAQGNIHDLAGKFAEKTNSAPAPLAAAPAEPSPYEMSLAAYEKIRETLRKDALDAIVAQAPEGAALLSVYVDHRGLAQSSDWIDADGEPMGSTLSELADIDRMLEHFDEDALSAHGFTTHPSVGGHRFPYRLDVSRGDSESPEAREAKLEEEMHRALARAQQAGGTDSIWAANEAMGTAAVAYISELAKNRNAEIVFGISDQFYDDDLFSIEEIRVGGVRVDDEWKFEAYDEIESAANLINRSFGEASGRFEKLPADCYRLLG